MLQYITSGESHGEHLMAILEGMPSGLSLRQAALDHELARRQAGYGRGGRMQIEKDRVQVTAGVLKGKTTGAPIGLLLTNRDFKIDRMPELTRPRPGHADLVGALKYHQGIRAILERASARETTMRTAVGAVAKELLRQFHIELVSHVLRIGEAALPDAALTFAQIRTRTKGSLVNCVSQKTSTAMMRAIDAARRAGDTLGGLFEIRVHGVPPGLGSHVHYERKLHARIAAALLSIQAMKGVEFGLGRDFARLPGSKCHDEIFYSATRGYYRKTNRTGGFEGGMTTGEDIGVRVVMKPISTLRKTLRSVNMQTKRPEGADFERSDICTVPAASVIGEAVVAFEVARALLEKCGGDSLVEVKRNYQGYLKQVARS